MLVFLHFPGSDFQHVSLEKKNTIILMASLMSSLYPSTFYIDVEYTLK